MRLSICLKASSNFEVPSLIFTVLPRVLHVSVGISKHSPPGTPATCRNLPQPAAIFSLKPGSWRPKLVTSVLVELVKQPSCRTLATADTACQFLQALGMGTQRPALQVTHGKKHHSAIVKILSTDITVRFELLDHALLHFSFCASAVSPPKPSSLFLQGTNVLRFERVSFTHARNQMKMQNVKCN